MPPLSARSYPPLQAPRDAPSNDIVQGDSSYSESWISAEQSHLRNGKPFVIVLDSTAEHHGRPAVIAALRFFHDVDLLATPEDLDHSHCILSCYNLVKKALRIEKDQATLDRLQGYRNEMFAVVTKFFGALDKDAPYEGDIQHWWIYHTINCLEAKNVKISWGHYEHKCMLHWAEFQGVNMALRYTEQDEEVPIERLVYMADSTSDWKYFRMSIIGAD